MATHMQKATKCRSDALTAGKLTVPLLLPACKGMGHGKHKSSKNLAAKATTLTRSLSRKWLLLYLSLSLLIVHTYCACYLLLCLGPMVSLQRFAAPLTTQQ
jgi:hypothetical protein